MEAVRKGKTIERRNLTEHAEEHTDYYHFSDEFPPAPKCPACEGWGCFNDKLPTCHFCKGLGYFGIEGSCPVKTKSKLLRVAHYATRYRQGIAINLPGDERIPHGRGYGTSRRVARFSFPLHKKKGVAPDFG